MTSLVVIFTLIITKGSYSLPTSDTQTEIGSNNINWRIVGGSDASNGSFPYQVSLRITRTGSHNCGGSILNSTVVLTAAHCLASYRPADLHVVVGSDRLNGSGTTYQIKQLIIHNLYNSSVIKNDIGLIILKEPLRYSNSVRPVELETRQIGAGVNVVLSGWGITSFPGQLPNNLQYINLTTISNDECEAAYREARASLPIYKEELCTLTRRGEGACKGDSGGPLVANGKQVGVVSWGRPCGLGFPDVFSRVSSYVDWIKQHSEAEFRKQNHGDKSFNFNFFQNDYNIDFERVELIRYNKSILSSCQVRAFKYNRTCAAVNMTFTPLIRDFEKLEVIIVQAYRFASNEYRLFPLRFEFNLCDAVFKYNMFGFKDFKNCGNFTCNVDKGKTYHICNWTIDQSKFPPLIPTGRYMAELQYIYITEEAMVLRAYGGVVRPFVFKEH
ncbi:hypothetical protein ILUMI_24334 [Ignelater luminosus]|uniref:Peptidase S1 domain-containing protein n=1 Tax=Ignelater luminosus TaxID=2038154 RepID=A0A8K0G0Z9_IGNLU|nr:hypothetical protein ILUMI_24334 [Ignelater luminosus]